MIYITPFYVRQMIYDEVKLMEKAKIVDSETGEITGTINEGDRILRGASIEFLSNVQEWKIKHFFKGNIDEIRKWMRELSLHEKAFLFAIVTYVSYTDCHLQYDNGEDIGTEELVKITDMPRRTVYEVISSLVKKDIIYKGKNSKNRQYFVNPWLFCKGNQINNVLKTMFKNYRIRVCGNKRWKDL